MSRWIPVQMGEQRDMCYEDVDEWMVPGRAGSSDGTDGVETKDRKGGGGVRNGKESSRGGTRLEREGTESRSRWRGL